MASCGVDDKRSWPIYLIGTFCLLQGVASSVRLPEQEKISHKFDIDLSEIFNKSFIQEELNSTREEFSPEALALNDTDIVSPDGRRGEKNDSSIEFHIEQEATNITHNDSVLTAKEEEPITHPALSQGIQQFLNSHVNITTTTPIPMTKLNRLRLLRHLAKMHRIRGFKQEFPWRNGTQRPPKVTPEMRQRVIDIMTQNKSFPKPRNEGFISHRCYRAVCALPNGTDGRLWNDMKQPALRLIYQLPKISRRSAKSVRVTGARLKLFVKPRADCSCPGTNGNQPGLIVKVYQFLRPLYYRKKNRVVYRRRILSDIKVSPAGNVFIALDVTSAVKMWMVKIRKNFGLEVTVQDVNKTFLDAREVFALPNCNDSIDRLCGDVNKEPIESMRSHGNSFGSRVLPFETSPYLDVVSLNQPQDGFEKYTLHPKRSPRQIDVRNNGQTGKVQARQYIGLLLSRKLNLERSKARRIRQLNGLLRNLRKEDTNSFPRPLSDLGETSGRPTTSRQPSHHTTSGLCSCRKIIQNKQKHPLANITDESSRISETNRSLSNMKVKTTKDNTTYHSNNPSFVRQNTTNIDTSFVNSYYLNSSQSVTHDNVSLQVTSLEWKVALRKLKKREPMCPPRRVTKPITDERVIAPKEYSTLVCPRTCRVCKGKMCMEQHCIPYGFGKVYGFMRVTSGKIVGLAFDGYSTVMKCRC